MKNNILLIPTKKLNSECTCIIKSGKFYGALFNTDLYQNRTNSCYKIYINCS